MTKPDPETINQSNSIHSYRTKDGLEDYQFSFEEQPDKTWRSYILEQPYYGCRSSDPYEVHRNQDANSRYWVDWQPELIRTKQDAMKIAAFWVDCNQTYLKYGVWSDREEESKPC
ncbi:MAG: hypothetical protein HQL69_19985 [Magnetococcales bacterium]|nr:hypothetical protein [Magnetococcales bacterium]